jgi:hypothetical protein
VGPAHDTGGHDGLLSVLFWNPITVASPWRARPVCRKAQPRTEFRPERERY